MKIALLFPNNLFTSPYLKYYINILEKENVEYDLIIWDRENKNEPGCIAFKSETYKNSKLSKTLDFLRFRKFIIKQLSKKKYSKVIVYTGQLGILLSNYLIKNYKNQYALDIRDYSKPMHLFKNRFNKLISNANFVAISSNGFKEWLPNSENYVLSHNLDIELIRNKLNQKPNPKQLLKNECIQVDTIGQIKDYDSDHRFVSQLKNNDKFQMQFIGFGGTLNLLKEFANQENIENISFHGPYKKEDEEVLLAKTDVINILISLTEYNKGRTLLSNRLYLSALLGIPCIVNANSEQSRIIEKYNFGIIVDEYKELPAKLVNYQREFNSVKFMKNCEAFLNDVIQDYELFNKKVSTFLSAN